MADDVQYCNTLHYIFALTADGRFVEINMNFNEALPAIIQIFDYDKPKPGISITRQARTMRFFVPFYAEFRSTLTRDIYAVILPSFPEPCLRCL